MMINTCMEKGHTKHDGFHSYTFAKPFLELAFLPFPSYKS